MPIVLNVTIPDTEVELLLPEEAVADVPMAGGDYRFTGLRLCVDSDGDIIKQLYPVTQPGIWSRRATISIPSMILR